VYGANWVKVLTAGVMLESKLINGLRRDEARLFLVELPVLTVENRHCFFPVGIH